MGKKIAVIGAGPAGLIAGIYLVREGNQVTLFEKRESIVSTPCGEGISHRATEILKADTGFDSTPYFSKEVRGLKNIFPTNKFAYIASKGYVLERQSWLEALQKYFEKQGGKTVFGKEIKKINELDHFDYIVAADGPNSFLRKYIGGKVDVVIASQYKMVLDWKNKDWLEFYWDKEVSPFYSWNFPKRNHYNVGVIGTFSNLDQFIKKYDIRGDIIKKEAYPIPFNGEKLQHKNIFLIGDAGGMANPFSKGGLAVTIYASQILTDCISSNTISEYEKRIKNHAAFSKSYSKVCDAINAISQKNLERIGIIVHGTDLLSLPITTYFKFLKHPQMIPTVLTIHRGFKEGIVHGW